MSAVALGVLGIATAWFSLLSLVPALLGIAMGLWGIGSHFRRRAWAGIGLSLLALVLAFDAHAVDVVGMFFFEDNTYVLVKGDPLGERLAAVARRKGILLMGCDQCCYEREIDGKLVEGATIGCFPNLYGALSGNMPDQVITL